MIQLSNKKILMIICVLILILILIFVGLRIFRKTVSPTINEDSPSAPFYVTPKATLPPRLEPDFKYPIAWEQITIEYKPRSGTFVISYSGNIDSAKTSFARFMQKSALPLDRYNSMYWSLDEQQPIERSYSEQN